MSTATAQPDPTAGRDAWIISSVPNNNAGAATSFQVGSAAASRRDRGLFAIPDAVISSIGAGSTITAVEVQFYLNNVTSGFNYDTYLNRILRSWGEGAKTGAAATSGECSWNHYAYTSTWTTAGCGSDGNDRVATASCTKTITASDSASWVTFSGAGLVSDVQGWLDGDFSNYGWLWTAPSAENQAAQMRASAISSDYTTDTSLRPKISITYTPAAITVNDAILTAQNSVTVKFSAAPDSVATGDFTFSPSVTVSSATPSGSDVVLALGSSLTPGTDYTLTVSEDAHSGGFVGSADKVFEFTAPKVVADDVRNFYPRGESIAVGGGYIFVAYLSDDYHLHCVRCVESTLASHGDIDLGYSGLDDNHLHPSVQIDPTDNKLVLAVGGRIDGTNDLLSKICKTDHAYGGNESEWAADDFGSFSTLPYPDQGLVSYTFFRILPDGTLVVVGSQRTSADNPSSNTVNYAMYVYRYVGDGTGKTAAQMAGGSWTKVVAAATDLTLGSVYPTGIAYQDGRVGIGYFLYNQTAGVVDRLGQAYIYTDNITDATPVWRKADGTSMSLPISSASAARSDSTLYAMTGNVDWLGGIAMFADKTPILAVPTITVASDARTESGMSVYIWSGSAWTEHERYALGIEDNGYRCIRAAVSDDDYLCVLSNRPDGSTGSEGKITVDAYDGASWDDTVLPHTFASDLHIADIGLAPAASSSVAMVWRRATAGDITGVGPGYLATYNLFPPLAPSDLAASVAVRTVTLTWTDNATTETAFSIERSSDGVSFAEIDTTAADAETYEDTVAPGVWYYRVRAYDGSAYSTYSNVATATVSGRRPSMLPIPIGV